MLTYLPHQLGYFNNKFPVIRLALESMIQHTGPDDDILVLDNGSCPELRNYLNKLLSDGAINFLVLTDRNIGKIAALHMMAGMAPGDYLAYSDDDILFYPGWLQAQLAILDGMPKAGMVSGVPVRNAATYGISAFDVLAEGASPAVRVQRGRFIPDEWETDWCISTGRDPQEHLEMQSDHEDLLLEANGVRALAGANHFQFVARKTDLLRALPEDRSGQLMGKMIDMDERFDHQGLLRLSTTRRYTRHIGNALTDRLLDEIAAQNLIPLGGSSARSTRAKKHWILRIKGAGRILRWLYDRLFNIINEI